MHSVFAESGAAPTVVALGDAAALRARLVAQGLLAPGHRITSLPPRPPPRVISPRVSGAVRVLDVPGDEELDDQLNESERALLRIARRTGRSEAPRNWRPPPAATRLGPASRAPRFEFARLTGSAAPSLPPPPSRLGTNRQWRSGRADVRSAAPARPDALQRAIEQRQRPVAPRVWTPMRAMAQETPISTPAHVAQFGGGDAAALHARGGHRC